MRLLTSVEIPNPNTSISSAVPNRANAEPDRVAQELKGLADRVGEQALQTEQGAHWRWRPRRITGLAGRGKVLGLRKRVIRWPPPDN